MKTTKKELPLDGLIRVSEDAAVFLSQVAVIRRKQDFPDTPVEVQLLGPSGQCLATARDKWAERIWLGMSYHFI